MDSIEKQQSYFLSNFYLAFVTNSLIHSELQILEYEFLVF